ncbi:MAG: hypothetical protein LBH92_05220 [Bacteroidales bacterium]|jgi:hypothetical protein|nr:hypothetical protein [Bacteroidales bacterium]
MKKRISFLCLLSFLFASIFSCKQEPFNPLAEWKDISIVYGFINLSDTVHYMRVCKAFLGEEDAIIMAQNPDSIYYPEGAIVVKLHQVNEQGTVINSFDLQRDELDDKDSGIFARKNIVYRFEHAFNYSVDKTHTLKMEITEPETGKKIESSCEFVSYNFGYILQNGYFPPLQLSNNKEAKLPLSSVKNTKMGEVYLTYYYGEAPAGERDRNKYERKSVVWKMSSQEIIVNQKGEAEIKYMPSEFFTFLENTLEYNPSISRINIGDGYLEVWGGSEELYYYNNINNPSGIVVDRPQYTNITSNSEEGNDAYGIFSSRFNKGITLNLRQINIEDLYAINRQFVNI